MGYYREYNKAFMSDVADDLKLDLELVVNITDELKKEGRIKTVEKLKKKEDRFLETCQFIQKTTLNLDSNYLRVTNEVD